LEESAMVEEVQEDKKVQEVKETKKSDNESLNNNESHKTNESMGAKPDQNTSEVKKSLVKTKALVLKPKQIQKETNGDVVFVGKKSTSAYVLAVMTQFSKGIKTVSIKARGKAISRAVDVAEIIRNKPEVMAKLDSINISTEQVQTIDGKPLKVSSIEIVLKK
jgi:archaea-specific DNA-binding protein